jgi:hypothetical protein
LFSDVLPLELPFVQLSSTVVGNGSDPADTTAEACEAEPLADTVADAVDF